MGIAVFELYPYRYGYANLTIMIKLGCLFSGCVYVCLFYLLTLNCTKAVTAITLVLVFGDRIHKP